MLKVQAPYQVFFPVGVFCSLLAVLIWLVPGQQLLNVPLMFIHSRIMLGGFLWSFIIGFLMTALPKMTGSKPARLWEMVAALTLIFAQVFSAFYGDGRWFYGFNMTMVALMIIFAAQRLISRTKSLPVILSHVIIALLLALSGGASLFAGNSIMGIHLYHVGAVLLLVLGIGTRFFSFLSGLPSEFENSHRKGLYLLFHSLGVSVAILLVLAGNGNASAYLGLALVMLCYLFLIWKIQRPAMRPSPLKHAVRVVALLMPVCFFLCWMQPAQIITWFHLLFIGCFSILVYAVATRVTLAHGAHNMNLEIESRALWAFLVLLLLTVATRVAYGLTNGPLKSALIHLTVFFWMLGVAVWCLTFFMRMLKSGTQKPSC